MDIDRDKRTNEDVMFRWDPRTHSMNFDTSQVTDDVFVKRTMDQSKDLYKVHGLINELDEREAYELSNSFKESTTEGLNLNPDLLSKNRDKRAELMKNLKKFQLHSCKDWLGVNSSKSSIEKVDTLDRLSSVIINPEFPVKHEAVLYSIQLGKSDYDFYNALFVTKLSRMSNPSILELIRQPVFVRNRMLLLTDRKRCSCPLGVLTKQQPQPRHFLQPRATVLQKQLHSKPPNKRYHSQGGFGDAFFNRLVQPQATLMTPNIFGGERSYANLFGLDRRSEAEKTYDHIDENDIVCPFHAPSELPDQLKGPKGLCGVIEYYNLFYKYEEVKLDSRSCHVLSLYSINSRDEFKESDSLSKGKCRSGRVYQYRLPSKLLAINHVYLRDFEYERYYSLNNLYNSGVWEEWPESDGKEVYISRLYSGDALFIVTKTEIIIALVRMKKMIGGSRDVGMTLSVLMRDVNPRRDVKEVLCHSETGRIFMLESSSLLYEYQYQLGFTPSMLKDYKVVKYMYNKLKSTKQMLFNMVKSNRVYNLSVRPPIVNQNEHSSDMNENEERREHDMMEILTVSNCLDAMESGVTKSKCYYPPLQWNEINYGTLSSTNIFRQGGGARDLMGAVSSIAGMFRKEVELKELCTCGFGCRVNGVKRNLKCINPWNKTFMKTGESIAVIDQSRWTLSLLNTTSGDLSVFYIHGYTTVDEYTKGVEKHERVFPYDLTLFNLKHGTIMSALERLGYGRFSFGSKFVKILPAPVDFVQGVDLILVDNNGVKVFVGFSNTSLTSQSSLISTSLATNLSANLSMDTIRINAMNEKATTNPSKIGLSVKGFRVPYRHMGSHARGPFALFRSKSNVTTFLMDSMFMTLEPVRKLQNGTLVRVVLTKNDSTSFFQNYTSLPLSINEEFYMFNESTVQYRTFEENQPLEYYHEFYIKLDEKEKIITSYQSGGMRSSEAVGLYRKWENSVNNNVETNAEDVIDLEEIGTTKSGHRGGGRLLRGSGSMKSSQNVLYLVTTEKIYEFKSLNETLVLKSLIKYPKNTVMLIKPPPLLNSNTHRSLNGKEPLGLSTIASLELRSQQPLSVKSGMALENRRVGGGYNQNAVEEGEGMFDPSSYMERGERGLESSDYFLKTIEENPIASESWNVNTPGKNEVSESGGFDGSEGLNRYLSRMKKSEVDDQLFKNIFGEDLVEICENSSEIIGYSLYYMSWLYGPENLFKQIFGYLVDRLVTYGLKEGKNVKTSTENEVSEYRGVDGSGSYNGMDGRLDYDEHGGLKKYGSVDQLTRYNGVDILASYGENPLSESNNLSAFTENYGGGDLELDLSVLINDPLYSYLLSNSVEGYSAFIASFGIPYKIFNYVAPGCYSVCEHGFEKPVISPWCKFVSFTQNKVKRSRVITNTTPLVDGLLLLVSELLTPMYYNRLFNVVPSMYTATITNPVMASAVDGSTQPSLGYFRSKIKRQDYLMDNLHVNRVENVNEFVLGERVDMYLTLELSMGLEASRKLIKKLYSLHLIVTELIRDYERCNIENVVQIMSTLAPNVVRMLLTPSVNQHEPYPTSQSTHSYYEPPTKTTTVNKFYNSSEECGTLERGGYPDNRLEGSAGVGRGGCESGNSEEPYGKSSGQNRGFSSDSRSVNAVLLSRLEKLVRERYENDLRTLKEMATVLQVSQEFLASAMLLHNNIVLGECDYGFDTDLSLVNLLPSKTPKSFFSPLDFSLNWSSENKFIFPFKAKFSQESPKSKLILTKSIINLLAQSNLINLFMNKEFFRLFRVVVWLVGENVSTFERHFFGHLFTFEEIGLMNNCNRVKFLQRQLENTDDIAKAEYIQSLIKQFTIN